MKIINRLTIPITIGFSVISLLGLFRPDSVPYIISLTVALCVGLSAGLVAFVIQPPPE